MALLLIAGCRLDVTATVTVGDDGSGVLRLAGQADQDLVARAAHLGGVDPIDAFLTTDLEAAGWTVVKDRAASTITVSHPFRSPAELSALVAGLDPGSPTPVLSDFELTRTHSLFSDRYAFTGLVDLTHGGISEATATVFQGVDPQLVSTTAGGDITSAVHFTVAVSMPGDPGRTNAESTLGAYHWTIEPGTQARLLVETKRRNILALATAVGVGLLVLVILILLGALATRRRR